MKHIILIARFGSGEFSEVQTILLTKGEEKQIENDILDKSEFIEESLDLGGSDFWMEIESTQKNINLFTELITILKKNKR